MKVLYIGNFLEQHPNYYAGPNRWVVDNLTINNYEVFYSSKSLNIYLRFFDFLNIIWRKRKSAQIVIIDTYSTKAFYFAVFTALYCKYLGLSYIPVLHGGNLPARFDNSRIISKSFLKYAKKIIAPSSYLKEMVSNRKLGEPIIIPNPIIIKFYKFKERKEVKPVILWVRSLQETYNPLMALEVLFKLKKVYKNAYLHMVGPDKGNMLDQLLSFARENNLIDNVKFHGKMQLEMWTDLSKDCSVFINTTNVDNTPVSVLEAMALGLPVVSTNVGGIPYLVKDGIEALLCNANDSDKMYNCIQKLINDPELASALSKAGRKLLENCYDSEIVLQQWKNILQENNIKNDFTKIL